MHHKEQSELGPFAASSSADQAHTAADFEIDDSNEELHGTAAQAAGENTAA